jgi:hypothetical protein
LTGIRTTAELPQPTYQGVDTLELEGLAVQTGVIAPEQGIELSTLTVLPKTNGGNIVLFVAGQGKAAEIDGIFAQANEGAIVVAPDLRGIGETESMTRYGGWAEHFGPDWQEVMMAYLLDTSYLALRTEDILQCARAIKAQHGDRPISLVATGEAGPPALHAAVREPGLFAGVEIAGSIASWGDVVETGITGNQLVNAVHGALGVYDLDLLADAVIAKTGPGYLTITDPASPAFSE